MRYILISLVISALCNCNYANAHLLTDTIPPPPEEPALLSGSEYACVGETTEYTCDLPLGCESVWYIDGDYYSTGFGVIEITWTEAGEFLLELEIHCDTIVINGGSLIVYVSDVPESPSSIQGDNEVCAGSTSYYYTQVGAGESCEWKVDGIIQISDSSSMSYFWTEPGEHTIEVRAVNDCGLSDPTILIVEVFEMPVVDLGEDIEIYEGGSALLDAGNPGCSYLWSTGETTQTIIVTEAGNYEVTVTNPCGSASDDINVDVIVGIHQIVDDDIAIDIVDNHMYIESGTGVIKEIKIFNLNYKIINEYNVSNRYYLPDKGLYIVKVIFDNDSFLIRKVIK